MAYVLNLDDQAGWLLGQSVQGTRIPQIATLQYGKGYIQKASLSLQPVKEEWDVQIFIENMPAWNHLNFYFKEALTKYLLWTDPITWYTEGVYLPRAWQVRDSWSMTPHSAVLLEVKVPLVQYT